MDINKATEVELAEVLSLSQQAIYEGMLGEARLGKEKVKQLVEPLLKKGCYYVLAKEEEQLMGWVFLGASKDQFTDQENGFIYELFVLENYRGRGIAKKLMHTAIEHLKDKGYEEIRLSVMAKNEAKELYRELGFQERTITMSLKV
ncbi:GNAT family N-acetyltransferase [Alkalihalobacillus pseudalcaliphilus]|uniref:GNAT family N-acetyltransferase n=1 Tax=Alkalihalobacillus pseudalcaliphilus TaxID=79884 RepID=UPI00064DD76E|nr:GNAT family N-acetyltransferase [Alkalihalobacillus pseudalcaliphilus]KMK75797.1 acetyltransferase [Alkalihalobacillus pseudalcaliphilus]